MTWPDERVPYAPEPANTQRHSEERGRAERTPVPGRRLFSHFPSVSGAQDAGHEAPPEHGPQVRTDRDCLYGAFARGTYAFWRLGTLSPGASEHFPPKCFRRQKYEVQCAHVDFCAKEYSIKCPPRVQLRTR